MLDEFLIRHSAPTLAGLKTANLFWFPWKDEEELNQSLPQLKLQLKALVARDLWDTSEYFQVMYSTNNFVKKALELLN